jgi:hypothetical protein
MSSEKPKLPGPLYRTWDEAMSDPALNLSKPWFVADPDAATPGTIPDLSDWTGWFVSEPIDETGKQLPDWLSGPRRR